ncbi:FAD-dependent oxidoreductase [Chelatococcus asaccharovorans]|uniref:2,4-dienoyl-CoA reductase-like NADH-dependent reductase (Old Yellow Enzyme family) n=1 Tax=Chelatococcus asaccharovorans TaxID=28210 RepID=A0A2V3UJX3_9HYPH|nr:FAD-dependent oxidoreductase [Chelatococcus asaccharovorans]MBS7706229.1 FAD-dependent oxidoreductase [Chelatococcus asaccharovorans]PXW65137.1 2,4-dienoyl-CoA reductase-like NADH-dependent reductase (Old Yellow Enzyme family) [Chelatococcus asaccharovorans]
MGERDDGDTAGCSFPVGAPRFPRLASPIRLAGLTIPNRTVMAAMSSVLADEAGGVTDDTVAYYRARAAGGTGLIVVEFTSVNRRYGRAEMRQLVLDDDGAIAGHRRIASAIREAGSLSALQLHSPGQHADRRTLDGLPFAPSQEISRRDGVTPTTRMLEPAEIEELVADYGRAATRAMAAGYEAIEIHGAHGYLPMAFLSPLRNRRNDAWGGDFERRLRFPLAVIKAVKAVLGAERPLIYRLSSSDFLPGGLSLDDMVAIVPHLVAAGLDAIHVSSGVIEGTLDRTIDPMSAVEAWRFAHCRAIRAVAGVPVIGVGPVRWPDVAERGLAEGDIDMVALGRPLLADPDWTRKALAGDVDAIRPCTNCNWCFDRVLKHIGISCAENPRAGQENHMPAVGGGAGRLALVVGAGPGGMAAALELSEAGFTTRLYEARNELGGGLIASASPPHKEKLFWYLDYLKRRLAGSRVEILLDHPVEAGELAAQHPVLAIVATGACSQALPFAAGDATRVLSAYDILSGDAEPPAPGPLPTLVYGGGETGCETAEYLAARGHGVILVTRSAAQQLARSAEMMYRKHLRARLQGNARITVVDNTTITRVEGPQVATLAGETAGRIEVAWVVVAQGRQPGSPLGEGLAAAGIPHALVGDVETIGRIGDAVHAARAAVSLLAAQVADQDAGHVAAQAAGHITGQAVGQAAQGVET